MSNSLQDQLRALGLAKSRQEKKSRSGPKKHGKPATRNRNSGSSSLEELSLEKAYALKRREEQQQTDKARRKKQAEDRQRRQLNNQIREIVKANRLNRNDAEVARNFLFKGRIRKINVSPDQLKALNAGELGIVYLSGGYHLLAPEHADKVRELSAEHLVDLGTDEIEEDGEFPVPDDLSW
jgi:uncharacterized protein YaiL (DUF2058 family)